MTATAHQRPRRPPRRRGPLFLLLPLVLLFLGLLHLRSREPASTPATPPGVSSPEETVSAWTGELGGATGDWLVATLAPLHADPRRQEFEQRSLARQLGLQTGQPWRLSVRWEASRRGREGEAQVEVPVRALAAGIALGAVRVVDDTGEALRSPLAPGEPSSEDGAPVLPLRTLLAPPQGSLRVGETADWILWGRAPSSGARLVGLVPTGDELFRAATGFEGPLVLRATRVRRGDLGQPLARLEREAREAFGKTAAGTASESSDDVAEPDGR